MRATGETVMSDLRERAIARADELRASLTAEQRSTAQEEGIDLSDDHKDLTDSGLIVRVADLKWVSGVIDDKQHAKLLIDILFAKSFAHMEHKELLDD